MERKVATEATCSLMIFSGFNLQLDATDFGILSNNLLLRIFDRPVSPIYMREEEADDFEMMEDMDSISNIGDRCRYRRYLGTDPDIYSRIEC